MHCLPEWCGFVAKYFGPRQLKVLLQDVLDHIGPDRQFEQHYPQLEALLTKAIGDGSQLHHLVHMTSFSTLLELLQQDEVRQRVSRRLLQLLTSCQQELTTEPALVELGMACCQTLHDSVTMLSLDDERRETSALICQFLQRAVDLTPSQLESSLDLLVQARGGFCNLESVTTHLVVAVHASFNQ
ncbi:VPS35 endosomal protein sorting factor-like [Pollicipes pollicipes]|uniref:VPS35 endosomal protein sorting factor-like n=1 Tax=Pollicipes pollicipes TaxID=41117 RepID=UPI0018853C95|nr:VPS35 endosomal protein sorting factor-like [Pollicipes pollicipes]